MRLSEIRILIVDDEELIRQYLFQLLIGKGFSQVALAEHGERAMEMIGSKRPHLIISDWIMPGINGLELLRQVRALPECQDIPFLMVTSQASGPMVKEAIEAGANDYVVKPFRTDILIKKVGRLLQQADPQLRL